MIGLVFANGFHAYSHSVDTTFMMVTRSGATKRYGASCGTTRVLLSENFELITYTINFGMFSVNCS